MLIAARGRRIRAGQVPQRTAQGEARNSMQRGIISLVLSGCLVATAMAGAAQAQSQPQPAPGTKGPAANLMQPIARYVDAMGISVDLVKAAHAIPSGGLHVLTREEFVA